MKKSTKGALASGAAAALLLGGAGTLAFWTATDDIDGGTITAGSLTLTAGTCTDPAFSTGAAGAPDPVVLFVPGDEITVTCDFVIEATGDNLAATLTAPDSVDLTGTGLESTVDVTYELDGTPIADTDVITDDDGGETLTATFDIDIAYGTADAPLGGNDPTAVNGNDTQGITAALDTLTISLSQVDPNP